VSNAPAVDFESASARRAIQFLKDHGTVLDPTLANFELSLHSRAVPVSTFEPGIEKVDRQLAAVLNDTGVPASEAATGHERFQHYLAIVKVLHRAGIPIVAGSD
jgi:hypothetical protein